ncbi:tyrosinase cofactor [Streptomyces sp. LP11]|uniref:Tyrosinase cofactor n=1 Tax=Streptomyces pyxinicus TaxID=2970331 RepID=A0ABT2B8Y2_9ACTN|nr:tyrosinase cofactor [Streptomyces sp. LP11]MCS0604973.1 tyrosinase cofactor [Streptomyces sp. LP11]
MVIGAGGMAVGTEQQVTAAAVGRPTRREVARGLLASLAALALAPVVAASRPLPTAGGDSGSFHETYRGRRIQGVLLPVAGRRAAEGEWQITIDGRPLHLMRRADGTWLSMADHYTSYATPLEATRAAVDQLGPGQRLRDLAPGPMDATHADHMGTGGGHGVRA